jgi:putative membrane protein
MVAATPPSGGKTIVLYLYVKAIHVMAVITLIGGMLLLAFTLSLVSGGDARLPSEREAAFIARVRRWDRMVTAPALGLVWIAGITLMAIGDWYQSPWLMIKIVPVILLSALHGMESGALRRRAGAPATALSPPLSYAVPIIAACVVLIAFLVVVKPF